MTGLKALNVNLAYCTGFAELKKAESDALIQFLNLHIHSSDDHYVRWKWAVGSIALWDNVRPLDNRHLMKQADKHAENNSSSSHTRELPFGCKERDQDYCLWGET